MQATTELLTYMDRKLMSESFSCKDVTKLINERQADPNARDDENNYSILSLLCMEGSNNNNTENHTNELLKTFQFLLDLPCIVLNGPDVNNNILLIHIAAAATDHRFLDILLRKSKAAPIARHDIDAQENTYIDDDGQPDGGRSALDIACSNVDVPLASVKLLLDMRANPLCRERPNRNTVFAQPF